MKTMRRKSFSNAVHEKCKRLQCVGQFGSSYKNFKWTCSLVKSTARSYSTDVFLPIYKYIYKKMYDAVFFEEQKNIDMCIIYIYMTSNPEVK